LPQYDVAVDRFKAKRRIHHSGPLSSQKLLRDKHDVMLLFGRATVEAIHYFKNNKAQTIAILKKYAKTDLTILDTDWTYMKARFPICPSRRSKE
jgi:hypothetical protein